jgi:hypothetical protein
MSELAICPSCSHNVIVHVEDGTCAVCQAQRAESPCFPNRGKILVDTITSGLPGEYVGRRVRGRHGSVLGNPFKIKTDADREDAVARYEAWLREKIAGGDRAIVDELDRLATVYLQDQYLRLLCWCAPRRCHGEVIAKVVGERATAAR